MEENGDFLVLEKRNKLGWIILGLVILMFGIGIGYYYFNYLNNPMYVFYKSLNEVAKIYESSDDINFDKPIRTRGSIKFELTSLDDLTQKGYDVFNDLDILYSMDLDLDKEIINAKISSKYQEKDLINAKYVMVKDAIYLYLDNLYDKYLKADIDYKGNSEDMSVQLNEDDINNLINGLGNSLNGVLKKDDFKREKETIKYHDKKIDVYNNSLVFDKNNYQRIVCGILNNLKNDDKYIETLNKILGNNNAKEQIQEFINEMENEDFTGEYQFIVYTKGYNNEFVKAVVILKEDNNWINIELTDDCIITMNVGGNEIEPIELVLKKTGDNSSTITLTMDIDGEKFVVNVTEIIENIDKVETVNDSNAVKIEDLTEDELLDIIVKLSENEGLIAIMSSIDKIVNDVYNSVQIG